MEIRIDRYIAEVKLLQSLPKDSISYELQLQKLQEVWKSMSFDERVEALKHELDTPVLEG